MCPCWDPEAEAAVMIPGHPGAHGHRYVSLSFRPELSASHLISEHFSSCKASLPMYTFLLNPWLERETGSSHETKGDFFLQHEGARYALWSEIPLGKESWLSIPSHEDGEVMFRSTNAPLLSFSVPSSWRQRDTGRSPVGHSYLFLTAEMEAGALGRFMNL